MNTVTVVPTYTLRRVKTFRGMDGQGLNAELLRDGKVVAFLIDEGCGGEMRFDWMGRGNTGEEALWDAFIAEEKLKIPADKKLLEGHDTLERDVYDGSTWVNKKVDDLLNDKRWRRLCKTNVIYQLGAGIGTEQFYKIKGGAEMITHLRQKYAGQKLRILNDEFKG